MKLPRVLFGLSAANLVILIPFLAAVSFVPLLDPYDLDVNSKNLFLWGLDTTWLIVLIANVFVAIPVIIRLSKSHETAWRTWMRQTILWLFLCAPVAAFTEIIEGGYDVQLKEFVSLTIMMFLNLLMPVLVASYTYWYIAVCEKPNKDAFFFLTIAVIAQALASTLWAFFLGPN